MKLAIICGSLEAGRDGVGDYTRQLAAFCLMSGHRVLLVALNDSWISKCFDDHNFTRLSSHTPWLERMVKLEKKLTAFQPDVISLQFVPYAFHARGFCHHMAARMTSLSKAWRWQIMFHELWLGLNPSDSLKYHLLGWWQRKGIRRLVRTIEPKVIHTHATAYAETLKLEHLNPVRLPLFSNIPFHQAERSAFDLMLAAHDTTIQATSFIVVFFGSLHLEWTPDLLMRKLAGRDLLFLSIGKLGTVGQRIWQSFSKQYENQARFLELGELTAAEISTVLQFSSAGVASSPWNLLEKSGSVAAMVEHGLPVIVTRNDFQPKNHFAFDPALSARLFPVWQDDFSTDRLTRQAPNPRLPEIGTKFLADLQAVCA